MPRKPVDKQYMDFVKKIGHKNLDGADITHDGYPLSVKEAAFIDMYIQSGNLNKALREAHLQMRSIAGKDYIADEIKYRMDLIKKETIADADEIMQYFTKVMRGKEKDQFGLDAPLAERTAAAKELAKRVVDPELAKEEIKEIPKIEVNLNWDGPKDA